MAVKVHILGSGCGGIPQPGRNTTALVVEAAGGLFMFDAGENVARTALQMGLDLSCVKALFVSHPHIDHVAGLPQMLDLLARKAGTPSVFIPEPRFWRHLLGLMRHIDDRCLDEKGSLVFADGQPASVELLHDGFVFDDGAVTVEARHNFHLGMEPSPEDGRFHSYSFRLHAEGKTVVFSGDVKSHLDMGDWLEQPMDLLIMDSSHQAPAATCAALRQAKAPVAQILFCHLGPSFAECDSEARCRTDEAWGHPVLVSEDAMSYDL